MGVLYCISFIWHYFFNSSVKYFDVHRNLITNKIVMYHFKYLSITVYLLSPRSIKNAYALIYPLFFFLPVDLALNFSNCSRAWQCIIYSIYRCYFDQWLHFEHRMPIQIINCIVFPTRQWYPIVWHNYYFTFLFIRVFACSNLTTWALLKFHITLYLLVVSISSV